MGTRIDQSSDDFIENVVDIAKPAGEKLTQIWYDLYGANPEIVEARKGTVIEHIRNLLNEMVEEEEDNKEKTIERVEGLIKEQSTLEKELHIEIKANVQESAPLYEIEANLQAALECYRVMKEERMAKLDQYQAKEQALCTRLGLITKYCDYEGVPSENELKVIQNYLIGLEHEERVQEAIFIEAKNDIVELFTSLETKPTLSFEIAVCKESEKKFKLSEDNMKRLQDLRSSLVKQEERAKAEAEELLDKLSTIWERLRESNDTREQFLIAHAGYGKSAIKALKQELQRCEELKRRHIETYIQEVRSELEDWWDRLYYSDEQKNQFQAFFSRAYSEELLELHEHEVSKLKQFYENNRAIYQLVDERNKLWEKMEALTDKGKNADRLFKNRGGQLLKEEKERKQIARDLPKIEKELNKLLINFEKSTGTPFLINGASFKDWMELQWKENKMSKEAQKVARKVANSTHVVTPSASAKRKLALTPSTTDLTMAAKRKRVGGTPATAAGNGVKIIKTRNLNEKAVTARRLQASQKSSTTVNKGFNFLTPSNVSQRTYNFRTVSPSTSSSTLSSSLASYSLFQEHLDTKEKSHVMPCRSSTSTRAHLRENNQTFHAPTRSTPLKSTPMKATPMRTPRSASSKIPTPNRYTGPRLTTARGKLPIII